MNQMVGSSHEKESKKNISTEEDFHLQNLNSFLEDGKKELRVSLCSPLRGKEFIKYSFIDRLKNSEHISFSKVTNKKKSSSEQCYELEFSSPGAYVSFVYFLPRHKFNFEWKDLRDLSQSEVKKYTKKSRSNKQMFSKVIPGKLLKDLSELGFSCENISSQYDDVRCSSDLEGDEDVTFLVDSESKRILGIKVRELCGKPTCDSSLGKIIKLLSSSKKVKFEEFGRSLKVRVRGTEGSVRFRKSQLRNYDSLRRKIDSISFKDVGTYLIRYTFRPLNRPILSSYSNSQKYNLNSSAGDSSLYPFYVIDVLNSGCYGEVFEHEMNERMTSAYIGVVNLKIGKKRHGNQRYKVMIGYINGIDWGRRNEDPLWDFGLRGGGDRDLNSFYSLANINKVQEVDVYDGSLKYMLQEHERDLYFLYEKTDDNSSVNISCHLNKNVAGVKQDLLPDTKSSNELLHVLSEDFPSL